MPSGGGTSTNDRGEYRIYNLAAGRYFLFRPARARRNLRISRCGVGAGAAQRGETRARESYTMTFYPSAAGRSDGRPGAAQRRARKLQGMDIQLRKTRTYTVQGKIAGFQRGAAISLSMQPQDAPSGGSFGNGTGGRRASGGRHLYSSAAWLRADTLLIAMADNRVGARQEVTIGDGDLEGLVVAIMEPGGVKGRVQMEASGVAKTPSLKGLRISLAPVDAIPDEHAECQHRGGWIFRHGGGLCRPLQGELQPARKAPT